MKPLIHCKMITKVFSVSSVLSGHVWRCQILHRPDAGSLPGERDLSRHSVQPDAVLVSGPVSEEEPGLRGLPAPGPRSVEGGV